ncbi:MAG: hypothetical protein H7Y05_02095 [Steroidobacteraceae bacterium]|nr:hypothetical protein [Deltaproteobacteria bacterium]
MSGCGGGSTSAVGTTIYDVPLPSEIGTVQLTALPEIKTVSTFAGTAPTATNGITPGLTDGDRILAARFNQPVGIATDGTNFYVADYKNNMIRKIDMSTNKVTNLAGSGAAGNVDGTGTDAKFNAPTSITVSGDFLYITDTGNNMIRQVHKDTGVVKNFAGSTTGLAGSVDSKTVPTDARFNQPTGITTDGKNLYVADNGNHTIRRIVIPNGTTTLAAVTTLAGSPGAAGSVDGIQAAARFNQPARITTDGKYLYVTDLINRTIRKVDIARGAVTTIAGISGPLDAAGNIADSTDGTGATARFYQPNGITTDGKNLYVTDSYNNSIRRIVLTNETIFSGAVTTLIHGTSEKPGSNDGIDGFAKFNTPIGITTDGSALYVADSRNHTIRKIE